MNEFPQYYGPDEARKMREEQQPPKPKVNVEKPGVKARFRVGATKPATKTKHYARKHKKRIEFDRRKVKFY